jgi:hypothetical protein
MEKKNDNNSKLTKEDNKNDLSKEKNSEESIKKRKFPKRKVTTKIQLIINQKLKQMK